jgi:hypothetical protein
MVSGQAVGKRYAAARCRDCAQQLKPPDLAHALEQPTSGETKRRADNELQFIDKPRRE